MAKACVNAVCESCRRSSDCNTAGKEGFLLIAATRAFTALRQQTAQTAGWARGQTGCYSDDAAMPSTTLFC